MSTPPAAQILDQLRDRAHGRPELEEAVQVLRDMIHAGNISNSSGIAIGSNIRMIVNQLNLPSDSVAALLNLRANPGSAPSLDSEHYNFADLLIDKTRDFIGREYVFSAIDAFLATHEKGYFILEGDPGMGKSAVLAEYVRRTGCICHFNMRAIGIVTARQFLENVCTQIIVDGGLPYPSLPDDAGQDGARLTSLLKEAAAKLVAGERLVIVVDALDEVDLAGHPAGANILFLPRILPDSVYFILTRRDIDIPFVVEAPQGTLKLLKHSNENRKDVELYIRRSSERAGVQTWISKQKKALSTEDFVSQLADLSENNFMYLYYVLPTLERGVYQSLNIESLPAGLQGYYEDHWLHMGMTAKPLPRVKIRIIYVMCEVRQAVSRSLLAQFSTDRSMQVDELTIQEVLDEWKQFLHQHPTSDGIRYSIYHGSFRDFLHRKEIVQAAGITLQEVNALIANNLWDSVFTEGN